jgi:hypothetical protein
MGPPSRRVTARIIAHLAGPAPCALCRCDIFPLHVEKDAEAKPRSWEDGLGRIRQLFNRMGRGTPTRAADQKSRFMNENDDGRDLAAWRSRAAGLGSQDLTH